MILVFTKWHLCCNRSKYQHYLLYSDSCKDLCNFDDFILWQLTKSKSYERLVNRYQTCLATIDMPVKVIRKYFLCEVVYANFSIVCLEAELF